MNQIAREVGELVGSTPLLEPVRFQTEQGAAARILVKLEYFNPAGSVKDRVAKAMIGEAERTGKLREGSVIIEPTSGNTGIGLAAIAASKGYRVILTMPETMSVERRELLAAYGAEIVLTPGPLGMNGAIARAKELATEVPDSFLPGQFENPANPKAHYETTGPEIWEHTEGRIDIFVAGVGTGGTLTGAGGYLKSKNPALWAVAVEPVASPVLSGGKAGPHPLQGIGAGFVPEVFSRAVADEVIQISGAAAFSAAKNFARQEGILVGISSGAALSAALELARRPENSGKTIVAILPDTGERYLSTELFR